MKLDFKKTEEINKGRVRLEYLIEKGAQIEILEKKKVRSVRQNAYFHVIVSLFAIEYGNTLEEVKEDIFKIECNPDIFIKDHVIKSTGEIIKKVVSSSKIDTQAMTFAIERFRNFSAKEGFYIPTSEEYIENKFYIDREIEKNKLYLHG